MRFWTRKSASIQPRTSLRKSDGLYSIPELKPRGEWSCHLAPRRREPRLRIRRRNRDLGGGGAPARACTDGQRREVRRRADKAATHHSFGGSFSAGSTPIFASKYAFLKHFQNLQENHVLAGNFCKFLQVSASFCKFLQVSVKR